MSKIKVVTLNSMNVTKAAALSVNHRAYYLDFSFDYSSAVTPITCLTPRELHQAYLKYQKFQNESQTNYFVMELNLIEEELNLTLKLTKENLPPNCSMEQYVDAKFMMRLLLGMTTDIPHTIYVRKDQLPKDSLFPTVPEKDLPKVSIFIDPKLPK